MSIQTQKKGNPEAIKAMDRYMRNSEYTFEWFLTNIGKGQLIDSSGRRSKISCLFHSDSQPSMVFDSSTNRFECYGSCGNRGSLLYLMYLWEKRMPGRSKLSFYKFADDFLKSDFRMSNEIGFSTVYVVEAIDLKNFDLSVEKVRPSRERVILNPLDLYNNLKARGVTDLSLMKLAILDMQEGGDSLTTLYVRLLRLADKNVAFLSDKIPGKRLSSTGPEEEIEDFEDIDFRNLI